MVKCRLKEMDRTQSWLAERLGVSRQAVSQFLNGRKGMAMPTFVKMLNALGLEVARRKRK